MSFSVELLKAVNKLFPAVEHPFNLQNEGKMSYAQWQYQWGSKTVECFAPEYTPEDIFAGKSVLGHPTLDPSASAAADAVCDGGFSVIGFGNGICTRGVSRCGITAAECTETEGTDQKKKNEQMGQSFPLLHDDGPFGGDCSVFDQWRPNWLCAAEENEPVDDRHSSSHARRSISQSRRASACSSQLSSAMICSGS